VNARGVAGLKLGGFERTNAEYLSMQIEPGDLKFSLVNQSLIISWAAQDLQCFCDLDGSRNYILRTRMPGPDTPDTRQMAGQLKGAGNRYLAELRQGNDTLVFDAIYGDPRTGEAVWRGVATPDAIKASGCWPDPSSWRYCPREWLVEGWAFIAPPSRNFSVISLSDITRA
jgi:hypothetical protein